jgi:hypothetical protein
MHTVTITGIFDGHIVGLRQVDGKDSPARRRGALPRGHVS